MRNAALKETEMIPKQQRQEPNDLVEIILYVIGIACLVFMLAGIISSCVFAANETIEPDQGQLIDSCKLNVITQPNFVSVWYLDRIPLQDVTLTWGSYTVDWVKDSVMVTPIHEAVREVTQNYMSYSDMLVLDKTAIEGDTLIMDFAIYFVNPNTSPWYNFNLNHPFIHFKYDDILSATLAKGGERSVNLGSLATGSHEWVIDLSQALPSWAWLNMRHSILTAEQYDTIIGAYMANCKANARIDTTGFPISQERIEQAEYQNITLQ